MNRDLSEILSSAGSRLYVSPAVDAVGIDLKSDCCLTGSSTTEGLYEVDFEM